MPPVPSPLLAATLGVLMLADCQLSLSSPVDPRQIALQQGDLPADLKRCPGSGPIDGYLKGLAPEDPDGHATIQRGWSQLRSNGAVEGAMTVYSAAPQDCRKQPGSGAGRSAATLVARFDSDQAAASAYSKGAMGFPTPAQDEQEPGLRQGFATQLSPNSWVLRREVAGQALAVAYWQRTSYTIFFVGLDLDPGEADHALVGVDGRAG